MAVTGPAAGRAIDRWGGRGVLVLSNVVLAFGLVLLGAASNAAVLFAAWCVLGFGMAIGLYEAAFASLVRLHGAAARSAITGITLIAGFASTVGWPVTALLAEHYGWRASCFAWAAAHIALALPINLLWIPKARTRNVETDSSQAAHDREAPAESRRGYWRAFFLLAL